MRGIFECSLFPVRSSYFVSLSLDNPDIIDGDKLFSAEYCGEYSLFF